LITIECPPLDDHAAWERVDRETGTEYHPLHGAVLRPTAKPWMSDVRRFYERGLVGADLCSLGMD